MTRVLPVLGIAGLLACGSEPTKPPPAQSGSLVLVTSTFGDDADSDGYRIRVDGVVLGAFAVEDTVVQTGLSVGDHVVSLEQLAANCATEGQNPRTVRIGPDSVTTVNLGVRCVATRAGIRIRFLPTGAQRDTNGHVVMLDGVALAVVPYNADTSFRVPPGAHQLELRDVAGFCVPVADSLRTATVFVGDVWSVVWSVHCLRPLANRIAYNSQSFIWTVRTDGSDPRRWALPGCWCTGATISRAGMRVAWWQQGVVWMYADSSGFKRLTGPEAGDARSAWSPDGRRLAYVELAWPDTADVFVINADGSGRQQITHDSAYIGDLAWSPDGGKIAYSGKGHRDSTLFQVWIMNPDGTARVRLNPTGEHQMAPSWSPDGSKIAYSSNGITGAREVWTVNANGTGAQQRTTIGGWEPTWSADGSRIAFRSFRDGPSEIYLMNVDGTGVTKLIVNLAPGTEDAYPYWGP